MFAIDIVPETGIRYSYKINIEHMIDIQKRYGIMAYYSLLADYCNSTASTSEININDPMQMIREYHEKVNQLECENTPYFRSS